MDTTDYKETLNELMGNFYKRMDSFEGKLQKAPVNPTTDALASEYYLFKAFVIKSMRALQGQIQVLAKETDQLEMRGRRKILLLHGLPEDSKEDTGMVVAKAVVDKLKQTSFVVGDISRCHRMGRAGSSDKPRPILCKFRDVAIRDKIWSAKVSLKGTGVTISEFLTKTRHSVFMAARQCFGIGKTWTREGNIFVLDPSGARHRVTCHEDLDAIAKEVPKPPKEIAAPVPAKVKRAVARK